MMTIEEAYPELVNREESYYYIPGGYDRLIDSLGHETLLQVDDHDYQGDSRLILKDSLGRYGLMIFGWGSCSGCDALQGCSNIEELRDLRDGLESAIKWYHDAQSLLIYFNDHDWEGDYSWHQHETRNFIEQGKDLLMDIVIGNSPSLSLGNEDSGNSPTLSKYDTI